MEGPLVSLSGPSGPSDGKSVIILELEANIITYTQLLWYLGLKWAKHNKNMSILAFTGII